MVQLAATTAYVSELQSERRRFPRFPFRGTSVVAEIGSSGLVVAETTDLSRFGCFVQTANPYPQGTRVQIEVANAGDIFTASGVVAYVTGEGMVVVFSTVDTENCQILTKWLSRTPRRSDRYSVNATAEVRDLGSTYEQVAITRDLSAGGCFIKTAAPLASGTRIRVRIEHNGATFTAIGKVTDNVSEIGMGIEFVEVKPKDLATLEEWLREKP
jgi:sorbitol-specific phosphotransferase system component IIA